MIDKKLITKYGNKIPLNELFDIDIKNKINTNSWFDITESDCYEFKNTLRFKEEKSIDKITKCKKVILQPSLKQKNILLKWLNGYRKMYNETLSHLNNNKTKHVKWNIVRTLHMKEKKEVLRKKFTTTSKVL